MLEDILTKTYYDNTISEWGISLLFIVGAVVVGKIAYWISSNTLRRLVAKTETKLDDIILDMIEEPSYLRLLSPVSGTASAASRCQRPPGPGSPPVCRSS